jgi:hypothetical protein
MEVPGKLDLDVRHGVRKWVASIEKHIIFIVHRIAETTHSVKFAEAFCYHTSVILEAPTAVLLDQELMYL